MEAQSDGFGITPSLVRLLAREGCNVRGYGYPPIPLVCLANRQQGAGQTELHCAFAQRSAVEEDFPREDQTAETTKAARLPRTRLELSLDSREILIKSAAWRMGRTDIIAGIALASLLVPECMAYAGIAGVPPQMGLYAAVSGLFVYAILGSSRQLAVTPTSSSAAMLAALVGPIALGNSGRYVLLASATTVATGVIFLVGGILKLGSGSEFVSKPVLKGFVFGLAVTIMLKQAHKLVGITGCRGSSFYQAWHVITSLKDVNPWTFAVGAAALAIIFVLGAVAPRVPSVLLVLVLGTLSVGLFGLKQHHVEVVGSIHAGMPSLMLPLSLTTIGADEWADLFVGTIGI